MMSVEIIIEEEFGWTKYFCQADFHYDVTLWFKGYLTNQGTDQLLSQVTQFARTEVPEQHQLASWAQSLQGHYALVVECRDWVFSLVDRVRSIPLFYFTDSENAHFLISGQAPQLMQRASHAGLFDSAGVDYAVNHSAVLEVGMSGYTIGRKTLYHRLYQLTAGEGLLYAHGQVKRFFYYTYAPWQIHDRSIRQLKNEFTESTLASLQDMVKSADGRQIVLPLSAGSDSRLIASGLRHLGVKNVYCFAYGRSGNYEMDASRTVAERLGYSWCAVSLTSQGQRNFFLSNEIELFKNSFDTLASVPHLQEVNAVRLLKYSGKISTDAIIVNGNTGDFISGGHIPTSLRGVGLVNGMNDELRRRGYNDFLAKHFTLWKILRNVENDQHILSELAVLLDERSIPGDIDVAGLHGLFELTEYLGRQSKYIVNMQRAYEFYGFDWRMPLWSLNVMEFWEGVPRSEKVDQKLYKEILLENNWGGVWKGIPVNKKPIQPEWLIPLRWLAKGALFPFGKEVWYQFERNAFQYFLDVSRSSVIVPYFKVLFDQRGQRHSLSWMTEEYLQSHQLSLSFRDLD